MAVEWRKVPDQVLELANDIIREHKPELMDFNIGFIFRSEAANSGGKLILGQAAKIPAKLSPFTDLDAYIWLAADYYASYEPLKKRALIHHELCHFEVEDDVLSVIGHDIEEFEIIVRLYGLWRSDLVKIAPAFINAAQRSLPGFERERKQGGVVAMEPGAVEETLTVSMVGGLG